MVAGQNSNVKKSVTIAVELVIATILLSLPMPIPVIVPLVAVTLIALAVHGLSFSDLGLDNTRALPTLAGGLAVGAIVAICLTLISGPVPLSGLLLLEGNGRALFAAILIGAAVVMAQEIILRGYIIHRMGQVWGKFGVVCGVIVGALLSVLVLQPQTVTEGVGVFVFSIGYAFLYLASKHKLLLPFAVHFAIDSHALVSEYLGI